MIQLLYSLIFSEMAIIMALLFKTPLRKLVIVTLDRVKRGNGPVMVRTVGGTILAVFASSVYSMVKIWQRVDEGGMSNPTDEVIMAKHMLDASLMGFLLFLALMIDRLHHYIRELRLLRKTMEDAKKQNRSFGDSKNGSGVELKSMEDEIAKLKATIKHLESERGTNAEAPE